VNDYKAFVAKSEAKKPFGRPGHRWEDTLFVCCLFNDVVTKSDHADPSDETILNNELKFLRQQGSTIALCRIKLRENNFLPNVPRYPKNITLLEGFQALLTCPAN
jgi:hypothetical protein